MIIKEYRIIVPMTVEEYQIGQLYAIQKKSRLESEGAGSGVEIIKNEPYENENERGQYTLKIYHVDQRMPAALKTLVKALFPKSALLFEEEGWNRYPYTRTKYKHQLFKQFSIDIETKFNADLGDNENVFNLNKNELSNRIVEYIDIVNDTVADKDYKESEDPKLFKSEKTNRGPLESNWVEKLKEKYKNDKKITFMCAYKLCRVECKYWGIQTKIESTICDSVLRNMLLIFHKQAWCWQDEYGDLSINDVRLLEAETQEILNEKMKENQRNMKRSNSKSSLLNPKSPKEKCVTVDVKFPSNEHDEKKIKSTTENENLISTTRSERMISINEENDYNNISDIKDVFADSVSLKSDEFFDALSISGHYNINDENNRDIGFKSHQKMSKILTESTITNLESPTLDYESIMNKNNNKLLSKSELSENNIDILIIVVHGGSVMGITNSITNDLNNLKSTFGKVMQLYYPNINGRIEYRSVGCDNIFKDALIELSSLSPFNQKTNGVSEFGNTPIPFHLYENIPYHVLPLFAVSKSAEYSDNVLKLIQECNRVYDEYLLRNEEFSLNGQVIIIGDSIGSILTFDALSTELNINNNSCKNIISKSKSPMTLNDSYPTTSKMSILNSQISCPENYLQLNPVNSFKSNINDQMSDSSSKTSNDVEYLKFPVSHFFSFGSLLGLLLAFRKYSNKTIPKKLCCKQIYNLFHLNDPLAIRIEPLLCKEFSYINPCTISPVSKHPYGDNTPLDLKYYLYKNSQLFLNKNQEEIDWWGSDRIDYVLYAPDHLTKNLPKQNLPYLFYSCFWESFDVAAFILRTVYNFDNLINMEKKTSSSSLSEKSLNEKWVNLSNRVKLRNLAPNHRANDVIVLEGNDQILKAKFSYGALDFALAAEIVDIYILINKNWILYDTKTTDNHGKIKYVIPTEKRLPQGDYSIMMTVRCDKSKVEFSMCVLPPKTEVVVFSIDGSFAANISLSGTDPKVRAGAVDIVRYWQELGYLIIYVTARPDIQQSKVTNWLAQHNFPKGMVFFNDGFSPAPYREKEITLKNIVEINKLDVRAGYGATRDIGMYRNLNLDRQNIFIISKTSNKKYNKKAVVLKSYAFHLNDLKAITRSANGNARLILTKSSFALRKFNSSTNDIYNQNLFEKEERNVQYRRQTSLQYNTYHGSSSNNPFLANNFKKFY